MMTDSKPLPQDEYLDLMNDVHVFITTADGSMADRAFEMLALLERIDDLESRYHVTVEDRTA